jgi:hypothetical protein
VGFLISSRRAGLAQWLRFICAFFQGGQPHRLLLLLISYSHEDKLFARRLHDTLQGRGIRC